MCIPRIGGGGPLWTPAATLHNDPFIILPRNSLHPSLPGFFSHLVTPGGWERMGGCHLQLIIPRNYFFDHILHISQNQNPIFLATVLGSLEFFISPQLLGPRYLFIPSQFIGIRDTPPVPQHRHQRATEAWSLLVNTPSPKTTFPTGVYALGIMIRASQRHG